MKKLLLNLIIITFLTGCTASNSFLIATIPVGGAIGAVVGTGVGAVTAPVLAVEAMIDSQNVPTFLLPIAAIPVVAIFIPVGVVSGAVRGLSWGVMVGIFPGILFVDFKR